MAELREELSRFLKARRAGLTPEAVGLPAGRGRRLPGLRREEVAALAGVGLTWYTWLEQARALRVSAPFLDNLARALRLSEVERLHLLALAQAGPALAAPPAPPASALAKLQAILDRIDSPAYARNERFDVLAWNAANTRTFGDFGAIPAAERNVLRLMFTRPHERKAMPNWEQDARSLVAKLRLNYGRAAGSADLAALVEQMSACSADFRRMWADQEVTDAGEGIYVYRTARGTSAFQHTTLIPEVLPELRIVVYVAVDQA